MTGKRTWCIGIEFVFLFFAATKQIALEVLDINHNWTLTSHPVIKGEKSNSFVLLHLAYSNYFISMYCIIESPGVDGKLSLHPIKIWCIETSHLVLVVLCLMQLHLYSNHVASHRTLNLHSSPPPTIPPHTQQSHRRQPARQITSRGGGQTDVTLSQGNNILVAPVHTSLLHTSPV